MIIHKGNSYNNYNYDLMLEDILSGLNNDEKYNYLNNLLKRTKVLMKYNKSKELEDYYLKIKSYIVNMKMDRRN